MPLYQNGYFSYFLTKVKIAQGPQRNPTIKYQCLYFIKSSATKTLK